MLKTTKALLAASLIITLSCNVFAAQEKKHVEIKTNLGNIELELDVEKAPKTVENFLKYVKTGFYDGTIFHRVISGFMIQGGGFEPNMNQKETLDPIENEADNGMSNLVGTIAMARTNDPHSATAQFFINTADNLFLNHTEKNSRGWGYAVFGKVSSGLEVVKKIESTTTGNSGGMGDVPVEAVIIENIKAE